MTERRVKVDGRKQNRAKKYEGQLVTQDDLRMEIVAAFCERIYQGQSLQEAAHHCGVPLSVFSSNRHCDASLSAVFEYDEKRASKPRDLQNPSPGMFRGPVEIKAMLANYLTRSGFFDKYLEYFNRIDPSDEEEFDRKMGFLIKNRFIDQVLPRTSSSEDRVVTHKEDAESRTMEELEKQAADFDAKWHSQKAEIEAAKESNLRNAERLKALEEQGEQQR